MIQLEESLRNAVRERIAQIAKEEGDRTAERVRRRIGDVMDELALRILQHYEIHSANDQIVIEVRKPAPKGRDYAGGSYGG